jgi:hypothetical protein
MKPTHFPKKQIGVFFATCLWCAASLMHAQPIYMNFDAVNAAAGPVDATAYLASFGITLTNVSVPGSILIFNDTNYYGGGAIYASSLPNFLLQNVGGSPNGISFTMLFRTPLQSLTFTRPRIDNNAATPQWTATAYTGANAIGSVGVCCVNSDLGQPDHVYSFSNPQGAEGITSLTITANGENFTAISSVPLDDFYMVPAAQVVSSIAVPTGYGGLAINPTLNKIYLSGQGQQPLEVDGATFAQVAVGAAGGDGVDVDSGNNNWWEADLYSGSASVWNSNNVQVITPIPLGDCPTGVCLDSVNRIAWVTAQCGGGNDPVWAINADTFSMLAGPIGSGGIQGTALANPTTGRFYLSPGGVSKRIIPGTYQLTLNNFGTALGVDPTANLLYALTGNGTTLQILDGAPDPEVLLASVALPFTAGANMGLNSAAGRLYVGSTSSNLIEVLNATNGTVLQVISLGPNITSVGNIAADSGRGRVYAMAYGAGSAYLFLIQDVAPPTIVAQPVSVTVGTGGTATLSVSAHGYPLYYQWSVNGTNIAGATGASLTLENVSIADVGVYNVTISNGFGSVTSQSVSLGLVDLKMFAGVVVDGPAGAQYNIQSSPSLSPPNWTTLTNVTLGTQPYVFIDYNSPANPRRFYRAVPLVP